MNGTRMRLIPPTQALCFLNLGAGALLLLLSAWALMTSVVRIPSLEIIVIVAAIVQMVCAVIGLASPRMRGR
jgi:hypothetical protein